MRELITDRPDLTESPYTVDAGHFQIEADIANYNYDRYKSNGQNTRSHAWNAAPFNIKAGLTNNTDISLFLITTSTPPKAIKQPAPVRRKAALAIPPYA